MIVPEGEPSISSIALHASHEQLVKLPSFWLTEIMFLPGFALKIESTRADTISKTSGLVRHHWLAEPGLLSPFINE
jgi:hypothetical protein